MFDMGYFEFLLIGFVALLLFGNGIPEATRVLGECVNEFKNFISRMNHSDQSPWQRHFHTPDRENAPNRLSGLEKFLLVVLVVWTLLLIAAIATNQFHP